MSSQSDGVAAPPRLSIIVVVYDMEREARRTLHSLSTRYQRGVAVEDYEVVVIDNGSPERFNGGSVAELGANFSYHYLPKTGVSPAPAVNHGLRVARGDFLGVMVDGARMVSPGVVRWCLHVERAFENPCALVFGLHLGPDVQMRSIEHGYDQREEDRLLESIGWPADGYRLFEIASPHHEQDGFFSLLCESNLTCARRRAFEAIGGFDERFTSVGGGMGNLEMQRRLWCEPGVERVQILGEATFHQVHGGACSGVKLSENRSLIESYLAEYCELVGRDFGWRMPAEDVRYIGHLPVQTAPFVDSATPFLEASIRRLEQEVTEHAGAVTRLHREVAARDEAVRRLHDEVARRDQSIAWLHAEVARRDAAAARLEAEIAWRDARLDGGPAPLPAPGVVRTAEEVS